MLNNVATTGLEAFRIGSTYTLELAPYLDGVPWDITGATVSVMLVDPTGATITASATVANKAATYDWTVPATSSSQSSVGTWQRSWRVVLGGVTRLSQPTPMAVTL